MSKKITLTRPVILNAAGRRWDFRERREYIVPDEICGHSYIFPLIHTIEGVPDEPAQPVKRRRGRPRNADSTDAGRVPGSVS